MKGNRATHRHAEKSDGLGIEGEFPRGFIKDPSRQGRFPNTVGVFASGTRVAFCASCVRPRTLIEGPPCNPRPTSALAGPLKAERKPDIDFVPHSPNDPPEGVFRS